MIQIWYPDPSVYVSLNGPSWYLAVCVLSYLLFPVILFFMRKYKSRKTAYFAITASAFMILVFSFIAKVFGAENPNSFFQPNILHIIFRLQESLSLLLVVIWDIYSLQKIIPVILISIVSLLQLRLRCFYFHFLFILMTSRFFQSSILNIHYCLLFRFVC